MTASTFSVPYGSEHDFKIQYFSHMIVGYLIFFSGISVLIGAAISGGATPHEMWVLLTLAGSIVASSTAFLAEPLAESTKVKICRALASATTGVVGSRFLYAKWDWVGSIIGDDLILIFGLGLACGFAGFVIAVKFIKTANKKAQGFVDHITDSWPQKEKVDPEDLRSAASHVRNNRRNNRDDRS